MKADVAQQRLVLELAELVAEIGRLDHRLKNLPEQSKLEAAQSAHHEANDRLAVVQLALADIDAQIAKLESEIDGVRLREDRDRRLLEGGTVDAKQLTEIQHELDTLERRQGSLEDSLLEVMERREELAGDQDRELAGIDDLQSAMTDAQRNCESARTHLAQLAHQARSRREELVATIDESLVSMYERQRARGGTGAATLQGRRCGACRLEIDRGELARIAAAPDDDVLRCPECSAILLRIKGSGT